MIPAGLIYKITNNINNKIYIGLTTRTFEKRMKDYEHEIKSKTRVRRLRRHLNKNTFVHNNKTYIFFIKT